MRTPKDLLNCGLGAHSNESSQPSGGGIAGGPAVQFQIQAEQPVGMRDPRPRQWGALGRCAARLRTRSCEECEAHRNDRGSPNPPEFLDPTAGQRRRPAAPGAGGPRPQLPRHRPGSRPRGPRPRGRRPQAAGSARQARVRSHGLGPHGAGGAGLRTAEALGAALPPTPGPAGAHASPPRATALSRAAPQSPAAGQPPVSPRGAAGERADAPPRPGAVGRQREPGGAGTTFRRLSAPRPLSSRGGTLRAAPVAAGYSVHCATYKSSLCAAILSLSVCGSCASPALEAESEGRRRRRKVRGAAPVPAEPPPQAEDGRTPAAGGACSPEVLGRSFPYPSGAAPAPSSEPNFVAGARSRRRLGTGPGAARRPGAGSWGVRAGGAEEAAGAGRARGAEGGGRAWVPVALLLGAPGGAAGGEGATRGRVQELDGRQGRARGRLWFPSGAAAEFGGGTLSFGMLRAGVGGGVGTWVGGSAFPSPAGSWGTDAGPGTPPRSHLPGR